jgi:hypothetical protein
MLTKQFFSETIEADLNDMTNFSYRDVVVKTTSLISKNEIRQIIKKCKLDNVSSLDEISNRILKILIEKLLSLLTNLFRACVKHDYHSLCFREVNIVILKKSNKSNYTNFKTYKFIALLNTIDKAFEFIIAHKINTLAEIYEMFLATQMKKRRKRIYETTLKLFIEQIHTIWNMNKNKMITLLNMNVANAYDHMSRERLMHNLRKREISNWIITWTSSFMKNRHITLTIDDETTFISEINADISQDSSIFLIFYFFYNADILKSLKRSRYRYVSKWFDFCHIEFNSTSIWFLVESNRFDLNFRRFEIENNLRSRIRLIILFTCLLILNIIIRISLICVQRLSLLITSKLDY